MRHTRLYQAYLGKVGRPVCQLVPKLTYLTEPTLTVHHTSQAYCVINLKSCLSYLTYTTLRTWIYDRKLLLTNLCAQRLHRIARETKQCLYRSEHITRILRALMSTFHEDTYLPVMYVPRQLHSKATASKVPCPRKKNQLMSWKLLLEILYVPVLLIQGILLHTQNRTYLVRIRVCTELYYLSKPFYCGTQVTK